MQLRKETNLYDDNAIADSIADVESKVVNRYGTCSTAAGTAAKVVSLSGFQLFTGARITVRFTNKNTASSPTLNVNSTGAKPIWAKSTTIAAQYYWDDSSEVEFTYDGTHWILLNAKTQTETFMELTSNGTIRGIFMQNGQMYVNMDYLQTGTLKIGGASNGNGVMEVYNSSGTRTGRFDNTALYIGNIASNLTSPNTTITNAGAITTNSLTANNYIYVDGNNSSYIKIPFGSRSFAELWGFGIRTYNGENSNSSSRYYVTLGSRPTTTSMAAYSATGVKISNSYIDTEDSNSVSLSNTSISIEKNKTVNVYLDYNGSGEFLGTLSATNLSVTGTKNRVVDTKDYGERLLYCYETASPLFGDLGEGVIGEDGKCYIQIDSIFAKTTVTRNYQVFLQKYGDGECFVSEREGSHFVVEGTPNLEFGWEIKGKQIDFIQYRLEKRRIADFNTESPINYSLELADHIEDIKREREVLQ